MLSSVGNIFCNATNPYGAKYVSKANTVTPFETTHLMNFRGIETDSFQKTQTLESFTKQKFDNLFPNGEINKLYDKINKDFKISNPASLTFVYDEKSIQGGGYNFKNNNIEMNLYDLVNSNKKIVGIKNGKKYPLISPKDKIPLFVNEELANTFVNTQNQRNNLGFDKLIIEDVTPKEQRKFILHKIAHECVHAKQHQLLRETEGINDKDIIKAWIHRKPKNLVEQKMLDTVVDKLYNDSPWSKTIAPQKNIKKDTPQYVHSIELLNAIQNYPPVNSPEYTQNVLEREAFDISAKYINSNMVS